LSRVPSSQRKPSEVEFITTAEKIHELVIKSIINEFGVKTDNPRVYWLVQNNKATLKSYVDHLVTYIYSANSIYPSCKEEVIERKLLWDRALGYCQVIETEYKLMKRELDIHLGLAEEILRLLEHEKKLLRGTKRSDAERYKHIQ
jgi:hypothetical protein